MKSVFVSNGDSKWDSRTGETVEILYQLGSDKADVADVGPMFHIRFNDGVETDAFIDELPDLDKYLFGEKENVVYLKKSDVLKLLHNIGGCGAEKNSWSDGWDQAINEAYRQIAALEGEEHPTFSE